MTDIQLMLRQSVVFLSALIYWSGALINAYRVRKHTGKSPNLRPKTLKEKLLWSSWFIIISGWAGQPFLLERFQDSMLFSFINSPAHPAWIFTGILLVLSGYAGTLWCYNALGNSWRIGVNKKEKTVLIQNGPYRFIRHPIYSFQMMILAGAACLIPTLFSVLILLLNIVSSAIKASDEETYLAGVHVDNYRGYCSKTGRFLPKMKSLL